MFEIHQYRKCTLCTSFANYWNITNTNDSMVTASLSIWWIVCSQCSMWLQDWCTSPLLCDLYSQSVPECIKFCLDVLVFRCRNQTAPNYQARDLQWADTDDLQRRQRSATTQRLLVRHTRLWTIGDLLHCTSGMICLPTSFLHRHWPFSSSA